jgi:uncharacterized protein YndB with AHSA1/START domain
MPLAIEETTLVGAPPEAIWRLLEDSYHWNLWWREVLESEPLDRKPLHDGSRLRLLVQPSWIPIRYRPVVEVATPNRALIWSAPGGGMTTRHAFYLEPKPNGTLVRQRQDLSGWGLLPFRLLRLHHATRRMLHDNLRGLKKLAERGS